MKPLIIILSWSCMIGSCALLLRGLVIYSSLVALLALFLRMFLPKVKLQRFANYDPFPAILPAWGMFIMSSSEYWADSTTTWGRFVMASRGHWDDSSMLIARIAALVILFAAISWSLFRDWNRFRFSEDTSDLA